MIMRWFSAHALYFYEFLDKRQSIFTAMENVLLVRARSHKAALSKALRIARRETRGDSNLTVDGRPARTRFLGIRRVVECAADPFGDSPDGLVREIEHGTEATYLTFRVASRAALRRLAAGKEVELVLEE